MKITLEGEPKEMAALLVETVKRQEVSIDDLCQSLIRTFERTRATNFME